MITASRYRNAAAALALAGGFAIGGLTLTATDAARPDQIETASLSRLAQATPATGPTDPTCAPADGSDSETEDAPGQADDGDQNDGESAAEPEDTSATPAADGDDDQDEGEGGEQGDGQDELADSTPGALTEGGDLLARSTITLDQAVAAARAAAQGDLGPVELEEADGVLTFTVEIGEQDVLVAAADGSVISVVPGDGEPKGDDACADDESGDDGEADETPGALDDGQDLAGEAAITVDQAVTIAQGVATGDVGSVDLEVQGDVLVYTVEIGDEEITVDATTGAVLPGDDSE